MRQPIPVPYNYGGQQPYFSGNSYSPMSQQGPYAMSPIRLPGMQGGMVHPGSSVFTASPVVPAHHIASTSANCDDSPAVTKKFNSYKENREVSNTNVLLKGGSPQVTALPPFLDDTNRLVDELVQVKVQLKEERRLVSGLQERLAKEGNDDIRLLQREIIELRNEKLASEQMDEEHSAKMKSYTQDLMITSKKYQEDIQILLSKNESLARESEVLRAKCKESERLAIHSSAVQEALNRKVLNKDAEISQLTKQVEKLEKNGNPDKNILNKRITELEALVDSQHLLITELEKADLGNAFGLLASSPNLVLSPGRRVSHLTAPSRPEAQDCSDWLEPLIIADHVLPRGALVRN